MPGSRKARAPVATTGVSPNWSVGPLAMAFSTRTSIPSKRSISVAGWGRSGDGTVGPSICTAGSALPKALISISGSSISVKLKNSATLPVTSTSSPTFTAGGPAVKTKMPLEVSGSRSARSSGVWMKKPIGVTAVTTLPLVITVTPTSGEARPLPWIS